MQAGREKYEGILTLGLGRGDDPIQQFSGGKNPRNAGAGMGAGPAKIEARDIFGDIVGAEPGALGEERFKLKSGALKGIEPGFEIARGEDQFADEVFSQIRNNGFLQCGKNAVRVTFLLLFPIDLVPGRTQVRNGRKDVKAFVTLGGQGRIGPGGGVEVEGEILGKDAIFENVVQETFVAGTKPDRVVGQIGIGAVGAEIDQEEGHAVVHFFQFFVGPFVASFLGNFFAVKIGDVGIGDDDLGAERFAGAEADAGGGAIFEKEFVHGGVQPDFSSEILEKFDEGLDEGPGSAHGKVNAPFALQIVDHGVDGGGLERVASDEEGMKGKNLAEALVFHMAAGHLPDGSVRTKANQIRGDPQHVGEMGKGLVGQFDKGFLEDGVSFPDKAAVAFEIPGEMFAYLFFHVRLVSGVFEGLPVVPSDPVKRMAGDNADIIGGFFSGEGKEFIQHERSGQDRGAGVVGEALVAENRSPTPGLF